MTQLLSNAERQDLNRHPIPARRETLRALYAERRPHDAAAEARIAEGERERRGVLWALADYNERPIKGMPVAWLQKFFGSGLSPQEIRDLSEHGICPGIDPSGDHTALIDALEIELSDPDDRESVELEQRWRRQAEQRARDAARPPWRGFSPAPAADRKDELRARREAQRRSHEVIVANVQRMRDRMLAARAA